MVQRCDHTAQARLGPKTSRSYRNGTSCDHGAPTDSKFCNLILCPSDSNFTLVLRTPDFRNCKAATEIRQQLNLLIDLYKEFMEETINPEAAKDATGAQNASVDIKEGEKPSEQRIDMNPPPGNVASAKPEGDSSQKQQAEDDGLQVTGSYVVGGSAFGWNFITYTSGKAMYYGQSKESFRSANVKSE
ncbi:hypothetical protein BC332_13313 [Capsicum chinense]|nr:hypothetical protein BC332_13313 [Capsicum chinense]